MMKINQLKQLVVAAGFIFFGCSSDDELTVQSYTSESFPGLTISVLENVETPFESTFSSTGGRTRQEGVAKEELIERLSQVFPDAVLIEIERETERGLKVWMAKIKMPGGGIIKIKVVEELGKIIKMKGKTGPYDYDFDPQGNFITFAAAKELALNIVTGDLKSWSLEMEEDNLWEYEFHIKGDTRRVEVEIKGFGEEVISVKEKHQGEDEDNDGEEDEGEKEDEMEHGDDHNDHAAPTDAVSAFINEIFDGVIIHSERHEFEGKVYWEVYLENEAGAVIKIKLKGEPLELYKIEGEVGPFDYAVEPGGDILTFGQVLEIVYSEAQGDVVEWRLDYENESGGQVWVYEFEVRSETVRYEMKINAITGEFIEFKESN